MEIDLSLSYMVMVMYVLRLGEKYVKYCRLSIYDLFPIFSFFLVKRAGTIIGR